MHHDLKLLLRFADPKRDGRKLWEFRDKTDRIFSVGDTVTFHIVTDVTRRPTGETLGPVSITYLLDEDILPAFTCIFSHTMP
jgi:hypothetical protein